MSRTTLAIDLQGQVALVTGAAGGMGRGIATVLRACGATVVLADLRAPSGPEFEELGSPVAMDVTKADSVGAAIEEVTASVGPIDILVNNAGIASRTQGLPFLNQEPSDWTGVLNVNLVGLFTVSKQVARRMRDAGRGSIVNISSVSGRAGFQTDPAYSASKAAVINLTQVMAKDLAPTVRVNCVCPGMVLTPFYVAQHEAASRRDERVRAMTVEEFFNDKASKLIPMRRGQQPSDIGNAVAFLASGLAANITGQSLNVDGGLVMS